MNIHECGAGEGRPLVGGRMISVSCSRVQAYLDQIMKPKFHLPGEASALMYQMCELL